METGQSVAQGHPWLHGEFQANLDSNNTLSQKPEDRQTDRYR